MILLFYILILLNQHPTNSTEQMEQVKIEHDTSKVLTPADDTDRTQAIPPPLKKTI